MKIELDESLSVEEYNTLRKSVKWDEKDIALARKALSESIIVRKASIGGEVVGMARVLGDGVFYYFIVDVIVKESYQKQGIGKKIIDSILDEVENRTQEGQSCSITLLSMEGKEPFYEKCGFTKVPTGYTGYGMIKRIHK